MTLAKWSEVAPRSSHLAQTSIKLSMVIHWALAVANWILQTLGWLMVECHKCGAAFWVVSKILLFVLYVQCIFIRLLVEHDFPNPTQNSSLSLMSFRAQRRAVLDCMRRKVNAHYNLSIEDNAGNLKKDNKDSPPYVPLIVHLRMS